jgi:hypothetical protein
MPASFLLGRVDRLLSLIHFWALEDTMTLFVALEVQSHSLLVSFTLFNNTSSNDGAGIDSASV